MRISSVSVKNFRSIDELNNVKFVDKTIANIIGRNGSGKSNLLYAILSLKENRYLSDNNRYEKAQKGNKIVISAIMELDENDLSLLTPFELTLNDLRSFRVTVTKKEGEAPIRSFEPVEFSKDHKPQILLNFKKISKSISKLLIEYEEFLSQAQPAPSPSPEEPGQPPEAQATPSEEEVRLSALFEKIKKYQDEINANTSGEQDQKTLIIYLKAVSELLTTKKDITPELSEEIGKLVNDTHSFVTFNVNSFIKDELWNKLLIILLDLNNYSVETKGKRSELKTETKHPFLFDLLKLTGKNIFDFDSTDADWQNIQRDASKNLSRRLAKVWPQHKINFGVGAPNTDLFFYFETPQKRCRGLEDLSQGEQWFLRFYTKLAIANQEKKQIIWLFDEPGQSLHATSQIDLKTFFEEVSESSQIVYTSHQPMMIQWHRLERIQVAENTSDLGTTITSRFWKDEELVSPLKEALGLFVGEQMLTGVQHVVVEGVSDYVHLQGWLIFFQRTRTGKHWQEENSSLNRTLIPAGGRDCIPLYLLFLTKRTKDKISTIAIPDSQSDADTVKKMIKDYELEVLQDRVKSISELVGDAKVKDIEDLYQNEEFLTEVASFYTANYPNVKLGENFTKPTEIDLKDGLISYINKRLHSLNPNYYPEKPGVKLALDKVGVAFICYSKLSIATSSPYGKETEKRFEKIFTSINPLFKAE